MPETRSGSDARPWLGLQRTPARPPDRSRLEEPADRAEVRLPPETPFRGDDKDTLELMRELAEARMRNRRRRRWVGVVVVFATLATSGGAVIERTLEGW